MNVSIENQVVWLAPQRTGSTITKKIFENYNFFSITRKNDFIMKSFLEDVQSHENEVFEDFKNFKKIVNIRNPYDRILSLFIKFHMTRPPTKNDSNFKDNFNKWVKKTFLNHRFDVFLHGRYKNEPNFINRWRFIDIDFDFVIRMENLYEDITKLPFIVDDKNLDLANLRKNIQENPYINRRYHVYNEVYEFDTAKLIYQYHKAVFYKFGYDPFSFTSKTLTVNDKISFIHEELI